MAKRPKKTEKSQAKLQDFVIVAFAEDLEQAKEHEALLKNNDIPATIRMQDDEVTGIKGIAIMVPEEFLDEAHVIIESQNAYDDFYDFAWEKEDEDFEDSLLEEDL
jgi:23S rRNA G2069 N7-methylase RlmK/C1962 C5-methylase RlmI